MKLRTRERALYGAIITCVDTDSGQEKIITSAGHFYESGSRRSGYDTPTLHTYGLEDQLRDAVTEMQTWGPTWRVRTISTPQTIYSDLQGPRNKHPEAQMLGQIGMSHLAEHTGDYYDRDHRAA